MKLTPEQKHDINITMTRFPDSAHFRALNTTSEKAMSLQRTLGAPVMGPARIKNTPKGMQ